MTKLLIGSVLAICLLAPAAFALRNVVRELHPHTVRFSRFSLFRIIVCYSVALANTSNFSMNLQLRFNGTDGRFVTRTVTIAPNSSLVGFVDQLLDLSGMTSGGVFIAGNAQSSTPFYVTGLMFVGPVFTTLVPAGS